MKTKKSLIILTAAILLTSITPVVARAESNIENDNNTEITLNITTESTDETEVEIVTEETTTDDVAVEEEATEEEVTTDEAIEEEITDETAAVATIETVTYQAVRFDNVNISNNGWEHAIAYVTDVQTGETQKVIMHWIDGSSLYGELTTGTVTSDREYTITVWNFYQNNEVNVIKGYMTNSTLDVTAMTFIEAQVVDEVM